MATEKRERHFLKRYLERRVKILQYVLIDAIEKASAYKKRHDCEDFSCEVAIFEARARLEELMRVIDVCKERGRF